jgi:hypothetical protein
MASVSEGQCDRSEDREDELKRRRDALLTTEIGKPSPALCSVALTLDQKLTPKGLRGLARRFNAGSYNLGIALTRHSLSAGEASNYATASAAHPI